MTTENPYVHKLALALSSKPPDAQNPIALIELILQTVLPPDECILACDALGILQNIQLAPVVQEIEQEVKSGCCGLFKK